MRSAIDLIQYRHSYQGIERDVAIGTKQPVRRYIIEWGEGDVAGLASLVGVDVGQGVIENPTRKQTDGTWIVTTPGNWSWPTLQATLEDSQSNSFGPYVVTKVEDGLFEIAVTGTLPSETYVVAGTPVQDEFTNPQQVFGDVRVLLQVVDFSAVDLDFSSTIYDWSLGSDPYP